MATNKRKADCTPEEWALHLQKVREYRATSKGSETNRASQRKYYLRNRDRRRAQMKARYQRNAITQMADTMDRLSRHWLRSPPTPAPAHLDPSAMLLAVDAAVRGIPRYMRDDAVSELVLALMDGALELGDLSAAAVRYAKHELQREKFGHISLDGFAPGSDGIRMVDAIPADAVHF